ncbi:MAG: glycoside hydrolase family 3 protein [Williamsia sp.]|nr:glycoside hydrolase family 3 protein [Williamsia sp.]
MNKTTGISLLLLWSLLICCGASSFKAEIPHPSYAAASSQTEIKFMLEDFYSSSKTLDSIVQVEYDRLTVKERAAQLIMDATSEAAAAGLPFARAEKLVADSLIGGLLFLKGKKDLFQQQIKKLDSISLPGHKTQLVYSCDCEPTLFHKKLIGALPVKAASDLKELEEVQHAAEAIASSIKMMGIQINFAPVADLALNKAVINNRSFGNNPADIMQKSIAFVKSTQTQQVVSCVKHFPGHGAVAGDTHKGQVYIDGALTELETFRLVISRSAPVMVMVGHMTVRNNPFYGTKGMPCSVSSIIIKKLLKTELGYQGIVVTDAMRMSALDRTPEADWKAIEAGADLVLMPRNARLLNSRIVNAFSGNAELGKQLEASVKKMLRLKFCLGNIK